MTGRSEALLIGGRSGTGKSSVGNEIHTQLSAAGVQHCLIEGDNLDLAYPPPQRHGLMTAVPAGSYLALSQVASAIEAEQMAEAAKRYNRLAHETQRHRSHDEVARFFDGLELVEPGLVSVQEWRPRSQVEARARSAMWGGVAHKR